MTEEIFKICLQSCKLKFLVQISEFNLFSLPNHPHLAHLNSSVCQVHDNGALRAEPGVQVRNARDLVAFLHSRVGSSLHKVLRHVPFEVREQFHLLFELWRVLVAREVSLFSLLVDEVNVAKKESLGQ